MSSSPWTTTAWDEFHRTGVEPPAPDVPPFRLEGLETRDPRRVGADEGDTVNSRDFEDGATLFPDRIFTHEKKKKRLAGRREARHPQGLSGVERHVFSVFPRDVRVANVRHRAREPTTS